MSRSWRFREGCGGPVYGTRVTTTSRISPDSISRRLSVLLLGAIFQRNRLERVFRDAQLLKSVISV
jgi:hypothetical protein